MKEPQEPRPRDPTGHPTSKEKVAGGCKAKVWGGQHFGQPGVSPNRLAKDGMAQDPSGSPRPDFECIHLDAQVEVNHGVFTFRITVSSLEPLGRCNALQAWLCECVALLSFLDVFNAFVSSALIHLRNPVANGISTTVCPQNSVANDSGMNDLNNPSSESRF